MLNAVVTAMPTRRSSGHLENGAGLMGGAESPRRAGDLLARRRRRPDDIGLNMTAMAPMISFEPMCLTPILGRGSIIALRKSQLN